MRISISRLTLLVALPFALVLVADVADTWLERRRGERNVLVDAAVWFEARDQVVRLARLADVGREHGMALGAGWTGPAGGGLGVATGGATLRVALPFDVTRVLLVEARQRGGSAADGQLRVAAEGAPLGGVELVRTWTEAAFELPRELVRRGAVDVRFESGPEVEAVVRRIAVTAGESVVLDDLDRADGLDHDPRDGRLTVSRPGRVVVPVEAAPAPGRLVARVRFLSSDGRLPTGRARLAVTRTGGAADDAEPLTMAELDASEALWRDLSLDVPEGEPVRLIVAVPELGDGDSVVVESVWRRPD
jgi:hypothetical protein